MKQRFTLCFLLLAALMGCNQSPKPTTGSKPTNESLMLAEYDMVMLDHGQLSFYNTATGAMTHYEAEKDSVVNTHFEPETLYYCVAKDNHILLRCIDLTQPDAQPKQLVDWGVPYDQCITETYGDVSPIECYQGRNTLGLYYNFSWDGYWFNKQKLYNLETGEITEWTWEWEEEYAMQNNYDENQTEGDDHYISTADELREYLVQMDGQYYMKDGDDGNKICLTDKMDFTPYVSDPDYATDIEYEYISSSPDNLKVLYMVILEWGDFPHGILAISSIDGQLQMPLEDTDCTGYNASWLDDGSLVYVGEEPLSPDDPDAENHYHYRPHCIKRIYPDNHVEIIAHCGDFQVKQSVLHR